MIIRDRRVVVVYSRGEARERERDTELVSSLALDSTPRPARSRARARATDRRGTRTRREREDTALSLRRLLSPVIALEGTPERRRRRRTRAQTLSTRRPQSRRDHPLNLSILLSGGKETNQDFLSSGERTGRSPAPNPAVPPQGNVVFGRVRLSRGVASRPSPS